eukprot:5422748-Karenia_brevis.AAC.1
MAASRANVVHVAEEDDVKIDLLRVAREFGCRLLHERGDWYFQSLETTGFVGGTQRIVHDGSKWLELGKYEGRQSYSRVAARFVQLGNRHIRDEMYEACEEFGEVIAIYFDIKSDSEGRYYYTGT